MSFCVKKKKAKVLINTRVFKINRLNIYVKIFYHKIIYKRCENQKEKRINGFYSTFKEIFNEKMESTTTKNISFRSRISLHVENRSLHHHHSKRIFTTCGSPFQGK